LNKEESENLNALVQHIQKLQEHTSKVYGAKFLLNGRDTRFDNGTYSNRK
jgi:hypothetical protein